MAKVSFAYDQTNEQMDSAPAQNRTDEHDKQEKFTTTHTHVELIVPLAMTGDFGCLLLPLVEPEVPVEMLAVLFHLLHEKTTTARGTLDSLVQVVHHSTVLSVKQR